jgi:hypothetical protein
VITTYNSLAPVLAFSIRNSADTGFTNICNLGTASTSTVSSCSYRLKVYAENTSGYTISITSTPLTNGSNNIQNANPGPTGSTITAGTAGSERYGMVVSPGSTTTASPVTLGPVFSQTQNTNSVFPTATNMIDTSGNNLVGATDTANTVLITHNLNISSDTRGGIYNQTITYTVSPKF